MEILQKSGMKKILQNFSSILCWSPSKCFIWLLLVWAEKILTSYCLSIKVFDSIKLASLRVAEPSLSLKFLELYFYNAIKRTEIFDAQNNLASFYLDCLKQTPLEVFTRIVHMHVDVCWITTIICNIFNYLFCWLLFVTYSFR